MQYNSIADLADKFQEFFPEPGFFLEIGAWDGEHISQSYYLEQKGWKGLCVDPFPQNFQGRTAQLCQKAISADGKLREFIRVTTDRRHGGDVSYFSGFKDSLGVYWDLIWEYCDFESMFVQTITMEQLYRDYSLPNYIEFLSIDTEGSEEEIINSIDFSKFHYGMIMFEHNGVWQVRENIGKRLSQYRYYFLEETDIDDVYIWEEIL